MLKVYYSKESGFLFAEKDSEEAKNLDAEVLPQVAIEHGILSANFLIFTGPEGPELELIDNYDSFIIICKNYYKRFGDDELVIKNKENSIDVSIEDISDLGVFSYFPNVQIK
uniref:Uncharacterized protein n=1 Tax=viral metagenome TaxID=1070528 RepID=A0A6C0ADB3_9ZZZZ